MAYGVKLEIDSVGAPYVLCHSILAAVALTNAADKNHIWMR